MKKIVLFILTVYHLLLGQETLQLKIVEADCPLGGDSLTVSFILYKGFFYTISDLRSNDLHLYVNDQAVKAAKLHKETTSLPVKTLLILDNSGSMQTKGRFTKAVSDLQRTMQSLPQNSLAGIIQVSDSIRYIRIGNKTDENVFKNLIRKGARGNTPLYDGIYKALSYIRQQKHGLFSIIAYTDGMDKHSKYTVEDCLQLNKELQIPITIFLYNNENTSRFNNLIRLSDFSGGKFYYRETETPQYFPQIPAGTQYTVTGYCPPSVWESKWQNIKLEIFYKDKILSAHTGLIFESSPRPKSNKNLLSWLSISSSGIMIIILILSFVLIVIWVMYIANKRAKTKKCPFCSKRYDIHLDNCPYCHQSTMNFYIGNNEEPDLLTELPADVHDQNIIHHQTGQDAGNQQATILDQDQENAGDKTKLMAEESVTLAYLMVKKGARVGLEYALYEGVNTIGRKAGNSIIIEDPAISGYHSKIWQDQHGNFIINDLATTNGTFVNDEKIIQHQLKDMDEITMGQTVLTFMQIKK